MSETITIKVISDIKIEQIINFCKPILGQDIEVSADDLLAFAKELQGERKSREYWHLEAEKNGKQVAAAEQRGYERALDDVATKASLFDYKQAFVTEVRNIVDRLKSEYLKEGNNGKTE